MKIPLSVRMLYQEVRPEFERLKTAVDALIANKKFARWHYESRLKAEESFALKVETGRVKDPRAMEDFFACTIVVENRSRVDDAERLICDVFALDYRRPRANTQTHLAPSSFDFDDLRLYVTWPDGPSRPKGLGALVFEVQVKTFLQHAWGIATHDFIYKADDVDWSGARIAFQVKAMLENAELSIAEARNLAASSMLKREDRIHEFLGETIIQLRKRWPVDRLPTDLKRLAQTLEEAVSALKIKMDEMWACLDRATKAGAGTQTLDLSPYGAVIAALVSERSTALFEPLARDDKRLFIPYEIQLPTLRGNIAKKIVRTYAPSGRMGTQLDVRIADEEPAFSSDDPETSD